ncbi:RNA dependent RNA polymerase-domain-containing protein [Xylaria flabelliformis]|nr:RNA dependent RNA polymerase-domain-containing protein [Xylaria flabelliformis]
MESTYRSHGPDQRHGYGHAADSESEVDRRSLASLSATPTNRVATGSDVDSGFDVWFLEFSNLYSLNLRRPNPSFLVERTGPSSYYDDSSFYGRLKKEYRQGNADLVLKTFDKHAREIHSKWVNKTKGEQGVTPSLSSLPRASTEPERTDLLTRLAKILDFFNPGEPFCHTVADELPSQTSARRSKRPSPDEEESRYSPSKRSRGAVSSSRPPSVLSRLDSGEVRASTPLPEPIVPPIRSPVRPNKQHDVHGLGPSVNTSRSLGASSRFSEPKSSDEHSTIPATQETEVTIVEASSQQRRKLSPPSVVESFTTSSSTEHALVASSKERNNPRQRDDSVLTQSIPLNDFRSDLAMGFGHTDPKSYDPVAPMDNVSPMRLSGVANPNATSFLQRLQDVWPILPTHFQRAPLAVRWEIMRVALYCGINMDDLRFEYEPILNDQTRLWDRLRRLSAFEGKLFPEKTRPEAWNAAMSNTFGSAGQVVVLAAILTLNSAKAGPLFNLTLEPLRLELPHRLDRRFGSDRFLELVMPSSYTREVKNLSKGNESVIIDSIHNWLVKHSHFLLGRTWKSFCTKQATPKKLHKDDTLRPETITIMRERVYLFAEDGLDFPHAPATQTVSPKFESSNSHTRMGREHLLDWLLQIQQNPKNQKQSVYKLFSRIALGLSRTHPTVVLQPQQIRHRDADIISPTGKVMNDGIARMSTALARQVRDIMGLDDIPAGFQGRFGSAKGFWIRDTEDTSGEVWIETYPSQRKWVCDFQEEDHRTFEVRNASKELKSATLNLQLLPILEDRANNPSDMKEIVGQFMSDSLAAEMESQKEAMKDPAHFRLWVHENTTGQRRQDRVRLGHVPWAAGLPISREDQMQLLLSQGFDPTRLEFLRKIAYNLRKEKCEELQTKLNVKVGRSTYAYMVVDFSGLLEEDEIHLGFSSKFIDEQSGFSETFLHGMDVLVARTPAHYPSDIQRIKAVFKPELGSLKDVIIFSTKGNIPLADKLSGGDYDGDIAWVCWEPRIVNNFTNAQLPEVPDLFHTRVLTKQSEAYENLAQSCDPDGVTTKFIDQAFRFNMEPSLLGTCTNYKEKLCYSRNSVRDEAAIFMSTLISNLVDRAKQGIVFSEQDWDRERKILNAGQRDVKRARKRLDPLSPQYKNDDWAGDGAPNHIIDYVKFVVGKPTVERELHSLNQYLGKAEHFDGDLVRYAEHFESFKRPHEMRKKDEKLGKVKKSTWETVLDELKKDIDDVTAYWGNSRSEFEAKLSNTYERWQSIMPTDKVNSKTVRALCEVSLTGAGLSQWDLLKASYCFKMYYRKFPTFPWYIAGYQLAYLKSIAVSQGRSAPPVLMTPEMYAGVRPDGRFVRAVAALNEGRHYVQDNEEPEDAETLSDQGE